MCSHSKLIGSGNFKSCAWCGAAVIGGKVIVQKPAGPRCDNDREHYEWLERETLRGIAEDQRRMGW